MRAEFCECQQKKHIGRFTVNLLIELPGKSEDVNLILSGSCHRCFKFIMVHIRHGSFELYEPLVCNQEIVSNKIIEK